VAVGNRGTTVQIGPLTLLSNGRLQFSLTGPAGPGCPVQASTDRASWDPVTNVVLRDGAAEFVDSPPTNLPRCFYRVVLP
jgi:hypothetical protein